MVEMNGGQAPNDGANKKRMLPSELSHKFSSKEDFLSFFTNQVRSLQSV
jgi:hypothetical protein